jgi:hypothetical protein
MGVLSVRRLVSAGVVLCCSLVAYFGFSVPGAFAAGPPVIEEQAVLNVAGTSATLRAKINPEGSETKYRFEYGTSAAYGSSVPVPDGIVGSGTAGVTVSAHPQDLLPSTEYHYRVIAVSGSETVPGGDGTFTTQPAGSEFALPDGRQWELVSPPNKHGALVQSLAVEGPVQASEDGGGLTYGTNVPIEPEPAGYSQPVDTFGQVLSARGAQGWSTHGIASPHNSRTGYGGASEYLFFSQDLSLSLLYPWGIDTQGEGRTLLSNQASELTPYVRREGLCDAASTASECYLPVLTGKAGFADVPPGTEFGLVVEFPVVTFEGASPDLSHVLLKSGRALTATPVNGNDVYEWSAVAPASEAVQLVSMLPAGEGGGPAASRSFVGVNPGSPASGARHSISDDGSRIFWVDEEDNGFELFMRDMVRKETVRIDTQQPGVPSGGTPFASYQIASHDGSRVFFTDQDGEQRLTAQSGTHGNDLYECEIVEEAGKLTCHLTDLTPETGGESAEVQNLVVGASEDGSYVYFVANGVLGDGSEHGATQGTCKPHAPSTATCNLYEYHNGKVAFIAALSEADETDWARQNYLNRNIGKLTGRVSPDGRYLAFMSARSLTGYDNRDAVSGRPDMEVYLYDAQSKHLVCASCNPTGSRPVGVEGSDFDVFGKEPRANIVDVVLNEKSSEQSVAANLPPGNELAGLSTLYQPRALDDSGRLFFNSIDALVPQDVNGQEDVYELDPEGVGDCTTSSVTFNEKAGGCVALISAGSSPEESGFLDASKGGGDVFFVTTSRLTSQDFDTGLDVYDAHECSASVPCFAPPVSSPPCTSGDSCKAAPSPQPSIFGAPASATFAGAGNVVVSTPARAVTGKSLTRAQRLARALRACRRRPKRKRPACERQARKRFGAQGAHGATGTTRKGQG